MDFVKLIYNGKDYNEVHASNVAMSILSCFLSEDVDDDSSAYKDIAMNSAYTGGGGNLTVFKKNSENIILTDMYSEETIPTEVIMTVQQFVQLLDEWDEQVCKLRPREVTIIYENDQYRIETKL